MNLRLDCLTEEIISQIPIKELRFMKFRAYLLFFSIILLGACKQNSKVPTGEIFEAKNERGVTINYMVTDADAKQIEVVGKYVSEYQNTYIGTIVVPQTVNYEGADFTVVAVGKNAFAYSEKLRAVHLPPTVVEIKENAFRECSLLNKITLPENLQEIGRNAFQSCIAIDSLCIPQSIKVIRLAAFADAGCKYISVPEKIDTIEGGALAKFSVPMPLIINNELFAFPRSFTSNYRIPANVVAVREHAFDGCNLSKVEINDNIKKIGVCAFSRCVHLDSIIIPNSIERIPDNCFDGCSHMQSCVISSKTQSIGFAAFADCDQLKTIHIPSSVSKIETNAFKGCWHLESISMGNGLIEIKDNVFEDCHDLSAISFPSSLRLLGNEVFNKCESLKSVELPDTMEILGKRAFAGCKSLVRVRFSKRMKSIGAEAFEGCESLKEAILPVGLDSLASRTFDGCKALNKIVLPQSIKELCWASIRHCESLEFVEIPSSLAKIGAQAFGSGGKTVLTIKMESPTAPQCHEDAFMFRKVHLLIPKGSSESYIWAAGWQETGKPTEY